MRKLFIKLILFVFIFLVMNFILFEWMTRPILYRDYIKHKSINIGKYNKVLFSDSRGESILQKDLDQLGIYNFSLGSDNYQDILFRIIYLHTHFPSVDTLILGLDKHMLSGYRENLNNKNRSVFYLEPGMHSKFIPYSDIEILTRKALFYLPFLDTKNAELYYLAMKARINHLFSLPPPVTPVKEWQQLSDREKADLARSRVSLQFPFSRKSVVLERYLLEIITYCRENHLILIGLNFPLTKAYLEVQDRISMDPVTVFRSSGLPVIDMSRSLFNNDSLFLNADHLNDAGSASFCRLLKQNL
ncbi:MAG: hypothetical protein AB9842_01790 [Bacteroidales bacterium]